jgi:hypothetical protein
VLRGLGDEHPSLFNGFPQHQAYYPPALDFVQLPAPETFKDAESYEATKAHELTHWTSHEGRCDRQLGKRFGDEAYAVEEIIVEIGVLMRSDWHHPRNPRRPSLLSEPLAEGSQSRQESDFHGRQPRPEGLRLPASPPKATLTRQWRHEPISEGSGARCSGPDRKPGGNHEHLHRSLRRPHSPLRPG